MRLLLFSLVALFSATAAQAAPPDVPKDLKVDAGQLVRVIAKGDKIGTAKNFPDDAAFFDELAPQPGVRRYVFQATKAGTYVIAFWTVGEDAGTCCTITVGNPAPVPPPAPPGPSPTPPPGPVTSFRVFLVFESMATLTSAQSAVVYGKAVEEYLDANCTGGAAGWRRRAKDAPGDADPAMATIWAAVQPKVTSVPCIAIEVNGRVEIISLEATPAAMVTVLKKYRGQ